MNVITIPTSQREELLNIRDRVSKIVQRASTRDGCCHVFCPHTTAGLTLNECTDPSVAEDMTRVLGTLIADEVEFLP